MQLFVYYAVPHDHETAVIDSLRSIGRALGARAPRTMRRHGAEADTWLEFYDDVDDAFEVTLAALVGDTGLAALTGPRHVERFDDISVDG